MTKQELKYLVHEATRAAEALLLQQRPGDPFLVEALRRLEACKDGGYLPKGADRDALRLLGRACGDFPLGIFLQSTASQASCTPCSRVACHLRGSRRSSWQPRRVDATACATSSIRDWSGSDGAMHRGGGNLRTMVENCRKLPT